MVLLFCKGGGKCPGWCEEGSHEAASLSERLVLFGLLTCLSLVGSKMEPGMVEGGMSAGREGVGS